MRYPPKLERLKARAWAVRTPEHKDGSEYRWGTAGWWDFSDDGKIVQSVPCPKCLQPEHAPCRDARWRLRGPHLQRRQLAWAGAVDPSAGEGSGPGEGWGLDDPRRVVEGGGPDPLEGVRHLDCPSPETRSWRNVTLEGGVRGFVAPDGTTWVPARIDEAPELVLRFTRYPGLPETHLVRADRSARLRAAATRARRATRELRRRGYV